MLSAFTPWRAGFYSKMTFFAFAHGGKMKEEFLYKNGENYQL